jgi:hypothetical protein
MSLRASISSLSDHETAPLFAKTKSQTISLRAEEVTVLFRLMQLTEFHFTARLLTSGSKNGSRKIQQKRHRSIQITV